MTDQFQQLLNELGQIFHLSLHTDKVAACTLLIPPELTIQLQLDASQERLFLFSKLIALPPGKFRENILREGLKANAAPDPLPGILAYLASSNHLVLFQSYPLLILNGERLAGLFGGFLEMADNWRKAIERGQSAPPPSLPKESKPFGLK
jgi:hypothetical protein